MPRKFDTAVVTIGIDPDKNTLHLVGLDVLQNPSYRGIEHHRLRDRPRRQPPGKSACTCHRYRRPARAIEFWLALQREKLCDRGALGNALA